MMFQFGQKLTRPARQVDEGWALDIIILARDDHHGDGIINPM